MCLGESTQGIACVKFGMLSDERDLIDLVKLVAQRGKDIEQSSQVAAWITNLLIAQYIESLADLVRHGIEAANDDLRRETEEKLLAEGEVYIFTKM